MGSNLYSWQLIKLTVKNKDLTPRTQRGSVLVKTSIGVITKDFNSLEPMDEFLENASKHNHKIYGIIIVYSHGCDF